MFSQLVKSAFYTDATVQRENQYGDFYLPPFWLFDCSMTLRGSAVLRGQTCHSCHIHFQGQRSKKAENLLMVNPEWKFGIKVQ